MNAQESLTVIIEALARGQNSVVFSTTLEFEKYCKALESVIDGVDELDGFSTALEFKKYGKALESVIDGIDELDLSEAMVLHLQTFDGWLTNSSLVREGYDDDISGSMFTFDELVVHLRNPTNKTPLTQQQLFQIASVHALTGGDGNSEGIEQQPKDRSEQSRNKRYSIFFLITWSLITMQFYVGDYDFSEDNHFLVVLVAAMVPSVFLVGFIRVIRSF